jgi:UDP-2,3-diacylglucosamine pyrophosphatase LpxH
VDINRYRTLWISDLHLGSTQCRADVLLDFLKHNESGILYLVGDIIDFWALSKKTYWPTEHNTVIQKVLRKARHGTQVIYVPGNHDENIREYDGYVFGDIVVRNSHVHTTADGKRYLVVHGDEYDTIARYHQWMAKLGSKGYDLNWVARATTYCWRSIVCCGPAGVFSAWSRISPWRLM